MMKSMGEKDLVLSLRAQGASVAEARGLAGFAGSLALVADPEIDAAFADGLEARLMAEFDTTFPANVTPLHTVRPAVKPVAPKTEQTSPRIATVTPLPRRKLVIRRTLVAAIAAAMLLALPIAAGAQSLPGSPFYKVKLAMEDFRGALTTGDVAKGFWQLRRAGFRADEISQLAALGQTKYIRATAAMMQAEQNSGTRLIIGGSPSKAELAQVESTLRSLAQQLTNLLPTVGNQARSSIVAAIRSGEAMANQISTSLGQAPTPAIVIPAAPADGSVPADPSSSGGAVSGGSDAGSGSTPTAPTGHTSTPTDPGNTQNAVDQGCKVPGSAQNLGDVTAPLAKVICTR